MEKPKCAVLGGSFNPPTKAHKALMLAAIEHLNAEYGIYVPSSESYVGRKVQRNKDARLLSERCRKRMLMTPAMSCAGMIQTSDCEYGDTSRGRTLRTLDQLQEMHPTAELHFIIGCDKLGVFQRWPTAEAILRKYDLLWVGRGKSDFDKMVKNSPLLSRYAHKMQFMQPPAEAEDVSSSEFWRLYSNHDPKAKDLLEEIVYDMVRDACGT